MGDDSRGRAVGYCRSWQFSATGSAALIIVGPLLRWPSPPSGRFYVMPNIKQQKKRVEVASRQRLQNLRYRSTVKTLTKRLRSAIDDGDEQRAAAEYRELVQAIDKAASNRALHRNTAARKKSQAARMLSGS